MVLRACILDDVDIDDPWLCNGSVRLVVNGVDVAGLVDAELNRRFPGRELRRAQTPDGLRQAWSGLQRAWDAAMDRAAAMPAGTTEASVAGEWSFSQTVRHLVMATDVWLRRTIVGIDQPFHPVGLPHAEYATDGYDLSVFTNTSPTYPEVVAARADRVGQVTEFLASVTTGDLAGTHPHPWGPGHEVTAGSAVRTIIGEEWEHLRYALRDLDAVEASGGS